MTKTALRLIVINLLCFFLNNKLSSQTLELTNGAYTCVSTGNFESTVTDEKIQEKFNFWLSKQSGLTTVSQSPNSYLGTVSSSDGSLHWQFAISFQSTLENYTLVFSECKQVNGNESFSLETITDENLKNSILLKMNDSISWFTKSLNSEMSEI